MTGKKTKITRERTIGAIFFGYDYSTPKRNFGSSACLEHLVNKGGPGEETNMHLTGKKLPEARQKL